MMHTAAQRCNAEAMSFLLSRGGYVTEEIMISAIQYRRNPGKALSILQVLCMNWSSESDEIERRRLLETSVTHLRGTKPLNLLFQKVPNLAQNITPGIIEVAIKNEYCAPGILSIFIRYGGQEVKWLLIRALSGLEPSIEPLLETATSNTKFSMKLLRMLLKLGAEPLVTENLWMIVARH
ncbi:hypothetical protein MPER_04528 [Moniliophthora perniciosa FA553]|nr:hypothetical protein MPER_04528 [Moniliophthora perniciosa FA553]